MESSKNRFSRQLNRTYSFITLELLVLPIYLSNFEYGNLFKTEDFKIYSLTLLFVVLSFCGFAFIIISIIFAFLAIKAENISCIDINSVLTSIQNKSFANENEFYSYLIGNSLIDSINSYDNARQKRECYLKKEYIFGSVGILLLTISYIALRIIIAKGV